MLQLACPLQPISRGELEALLDSSVRISDRAFEVTPADAELDRKIARVPFPINERSARLPDQISHIAQWNVTVRGLYGDVPYLFRCAPVSRKKPHDDSKAALAIEHLSDGLAADGGLHDTVYVIRRDSITRGALPVNSNQQVGLPQHRIYPQVRHAGDALHDLLDAVCRRLKLRQVIAENLDRVLSLYSGHRFVHVVLNILREVVGHAGNLPEIRLHLPHQILLR